MTDMTNETEQAKHTPGPWIYQGASETGLSIWAGHRLVGEAWPGTSAIDHHDRIHYEEMVCNARLITAAPELLEALGRFVEGIEHSPTCAVSYCANNPTAKKPSICPWCQARAAIAKATGVTK